MSNRNWLRRAESAPTSAGARGGAGRLLRASYRAGGVAVTGAAAMLSMTLVASAAPAPPGTSGLPGLTSGQPATTSSAPAMSMPDLGGLTSPLTGGPQDPAPVPPPGASNSSPGGLSDPLGGLLSPGGPSSPLSLTTTPGVSNPDDPCNPNGPVNVTTPGAASKSPAGYPNYYGVPTCTPSSRGTVSPDGTATYAPGAPGNSDWYGYQEYSPLCFVRSVTCMNWWFQKFNTGGPFNDPFMRLNGTSLGVAPCLPNLSVARWNSPLFTYDSPAGTNTGTISLYNRQTDLLVGEGHSAIKVELLDQWGHVITTAAGPFLTFPYGNWRHMVVHFDPSKLVFGENYRISFFAMTMHAETIANLGNEDIADVTLTTTTTGVPPATAQTGLQTHESNQQICRPKTGSIGVIGGLLSGGQADLCPLGNELGGALGPLLDAANQALKSGPLSGLLDRLGGVFAVGDLTTGQFAGWLIGREGMPSIDPRNLLIYVRN
ncbi:MAG TPA: hypothetical protein VKU39_07465, partial [Streptosporangiaceae bacterium]|nr:hypothetical protein [Streptosporangiaceae bacterium]